MSAANGLLVARKFGDGTTAHRIPYPGGAVLRHGDDARAIGAESRAAHRPLMAAESGEMFAIRRIPDPRGAVGRCGGDASAVRAELRMADGPPVARESREHSARAGVPDAGGVVVRSGDDPCAIRAELCAPDRALMIENRDRRMKIRGIQQCDRLLGCERRLRRILTGARQIRECVPILAACGQVTRGPAIGLRRARQEPDRAFVAGLKSGAGQIAGHFFSVLRLLRTFSRFSRDASRISAIRSESFPAFSSVPNIPTAFV